MADDLRPGDNTARNAEIIQLRRQGVGPREIARRLKLSPCAVAGVLHRAGMTEKPSSPRGKYTNEFKRDAVDYLLAHTWSAAAAKYGVGQGHLGQWFRRFAREGAA